MGFKLGQKLIDKIRGKNYKKENIIQHENRVSNAESMQPFADWVLKYTDFRPELIFEIGANYAQDAEGLRYYFNLPAENIWVFEAHPNICSEISKMYNFHVFNKAVFNENKSMVFNIVNISSTKNSGISSLYKHQSSEEKMNTVNIEAIRMDTFMEEHDIKKIDFLKLDAEGCNWEVLDGFGTRLKDVRIIHLEAEHEEVWQGQKLYEDIVKILKENGFEQVYFQRYLSQSDSLWIQKEYIKKDIKDEI